MHVLQLERPSLSVQNRHSHQTNGDPYTPQVEGCPAAGGQPVQQEGPPTNAI